MVSTNILAALLLSTRIDNKNCYLSTKSLYWNTFWRIMCNFIHYRPFKNI